MKTGGLKKMSLRKLSIVLLALLLAAMAIVPIVSADGQITKGDNFQLSQLKPDDSQTKVVIRNGFSFAQGDSQTVIPLGSIIQHSSDGITRVFDSDGKQISISQDIDSPKIPTPYGDLPAVNINQIPDGSSIDVKDNGITNVYSKGQRVLTVISPAGKKIPVASTSGWIEDSYAWNIPELGQFIADWTVPSSPPNRQTGAIDYIFNGIQPGNSVGIVQPVLEYNVAGTHQWTGAPWYVDSNNLGYRGTPISTSVGHTVRGTLGWNQNLNRWNIIFQDLSNGGYSSSFSTNAPNIGTNNVGAFCALEGKNINNDNDVPGTITFYNMRFRNVNLNPVSFSWNKYTNTGMGLTNLNVAWSGMTPVTLWTKNP
ncbi:MAG: hypothetical protein ABSB80_11440 [Methanoregula sp.]|jgi:hypothetical protein|uniref:hypothetical protein n=1 Tax=Methanoregula sp. TaxID=2052170 RepID=UPI003D102ECF